MATTNTAMPPLPALLSLAQARIPATLEIFLAAQSPPATRLSAAVRYAVMNGGKRVRPALVYGAVLATGGRAEHADYAALAVELIHCYSLVHDDLPCMDDDDLRRGQPSCHKAFDEATALLAGDTLQSLAFLALGHAPLSAEQICAQTHALSRAAIDMAAGQALDLDAEGRVIDLPALEQIHRHKTGALIRASVALGGICANANTATLAALDTYASQLGLAFQVHDDVIDITSDTATLGKTAGADIARAKSTYPALLGLALAQHHAQQLHASAIAALAPLNPQAAALTELANFLVQRRH